MANIWEKFDREIDIEGLQKDIQEAAKTGTGRIQSRAGGNGHSPIRQAGR